MVIRQQRLDEAMETMNPYMIPELVDEIMRVRLALENLHLELVREQYSNHVDKALVRYVLRAVKQVLGKPLSKGDPDE